MNPLEYYHLFVIATFTFWILGIFLSIKKNWFWASLLGSFVVVVFLGALWISLGRPPLKTLGETRLWYACILPLCGFLVELRWKYKWLTIYCVCMAMLFLVINLFSPEAFDKTLAPALQSIWFIPHVIVYVLGYALLGGSFLVGLHGLYQNLVKKGDFVRTAEIGDHFVWLGLIFISAGLVFGGLWAKEAWGHYWTWDPKETWALISWLVYLIYLHLTYHRKIEPRYKFVVLLVAFSVLLICWFGISYVSAFKPSIHAYN